jgi:excisionase family DNA binding protein
MSSQMMNDAGSNNFEPLLPLREAAELLAMHWKTLEAFAREGRVPATKVGKRLRFRASVLDRWIHSRLTPRRVNGDLAGDGRLDSQPRRAS